MKTLKKNNNKYNKIFNKYCGKKKYLSLKDLNKLIKNEFKLEYSKNIMNSCMNIWGIKKKDKYIIDINKFKDMFTMKEGFFKNIKL